MTTFADFASTKKGSRGCTRCGADKNAGAVAVGLRRLDGGGRMTDHLGSRTRSLCEPCSIDVYEHLLAEFDEQIKRKAG
jgi:hypothetical protein